MHPRRGNIKLLVCPNENLRVTSAAWRRAEDVVRADRFDVCVSDTRVECTIPVQNVLSGPDDRCSISVTEFHMPGGRKENRRTMVKVSRPQKWWGRIECSRLYGSQLVCTERWPSERSWDIQIRWGLILISYETRCLNGKLNCNFVMIVMYQWELTEKSFIHSFTYDCFVQTYISNLSYELIWIPEIRTLGFVTLLSPLLLPRWHDFW